MPCGWYRVRSGRTRRTKGPIGFRRRSGTARRQTVHKVHHIGRSKLTQTTEQGLTRTNVALRTHRPRPHARPRRGPETWTATELTKFLRTAAGHRLYPARCVLLGAV